MKLRVEILDHFTSCALIRYLYNLGREENTIGAWRGLRPLYVLPTQLLCSFFYIKIIILKKGLESMILLGILNILPVMWYTTMAHELGKGKKLGTLQLKSNGKAKRAKNNQQSKGRNEQVNILETTLLLTLSIPKIY